MFPPARDRTWVASVTDQHHNHYTTSTVDSISEIKYLYRYNMYIGKLRKAGDVVVSSNCFQRWIAERLKIRIVNNDTRGNNFILWLRA